MGLFGRKREKNVFSQIDKLERESSASASISVGIELRQAFNVVKNKVEELFSKFTYEEKDILLAAITNEISEAKRHSVKNEAQCQATIKLIKHVINIILERVVPTKDKFFINEQIVFLIYLIRSYNTEDCKYLNNTLFERFKNRIELTKVLCEKHEKLKEVNDNIIRLIKLCDLPTTTQEEKIRNLNQISYLEDVDKVEIRAEIAELEDAIYGLEEAEKAEEGFVKGEIIRNNSIRFNEFKRLATKRAEQQEEMAYEKEKLAELITSHKTEVINNTKSSKTSLKDSIRQGVEASNAGIENRLNKDDALINSAPKEDVDAMVAKLKEKYSID